MPQHLADPCDALRRVHDWLKPDGLLFLEVPNLAGARKQAANTFHTAHIWNFTPETLERLAWQEGFVARMRQDGAGTSVVFRKRSAGDLPPTGTGAELAERLARQIATMGRPRAYLLSGSPLQRRVARLRRNRAAQAEHRREDRLCPLRDRARHGGRDPRNGVARVGTPPAAPLCRLSRVNQASCLGLRRHQVDASGLLRRG